MRLVATLIESMSYPASLGRMVVAENAK